MIDPAVTRLDPLVGSVIDGKYRLEARVGEGATGVVYEARQMPLELRLAIKILHRDLQTQLSFVSRFHVEAKAASLIQHENTAHILDFGLDSARGYLYICTEYLDGWTLAEMLGMGAKLPSTRIVDILLQTVAALGAAHKVGILHRAICPKHIVVQQRQSDDGQERDFVKVRDFGIANPSADAAATDYQSPEQVRGDALDAKSDLYSAGAILYRLLSGRVPDHRVTPSSVGPNVDPELEAICLRAMSEDPLDRYSSAREMRAALRSTFAFQSLSERGWPSEAPSTGVSMPAGFLDSASGGDAHVSRLSVPTPFMALPVAEMAGIAREQMETRRPPAPSSEGSLQWEDPATADVHLRRAKTEASQRRREIAVMESVPPPMHAAPSLRRRDRPWLVPLFSGLMVAALVTTVAWTRLRAPSSVKPASAAQLDPPATAQVPTQVTSHVQAPLPEIAVAPSASAPSAPAPTPVLAIVTVPDEPHGKTTTAARSIVEAPAVTTQPTPAVIAAPAPTPIPTPTPTRVLVPAPVTTAAASDVAVAAVPVTPAVPTPAAPSIAVAPPVGLFRPDAARVDVVKTETDRVTARAVGDAVRHANVQRCYVDALKRLGSAREGTATLTLTVDESRVSSVHLSGIDLPGLASCITGQLTNARIANADMGTATATVTLQLSMP